MTSSDHNNDEDFLESLGISLDTDLTADADTHASVTGIYAKAGTDAFGLEIVPVKPSYHSAQKIAEGSKDLFDTCTLEQDSKATDPSSSTPVEGPSRAGPSHSAGPSRAPRAVTDATEPLRPDLANLHLPYSMSYHTSDNTLAFREVSLANVNRWNLPSDSINEVMADKSFTKRIRKRFNIDLCFLHDFQVPDGLVSQMMELILGMEQELSSAWTLRAFDDQRRRRPRR
ncbi:hypothetical protein JCGZ_06836 [Jatropha curcas]|uniref:Uncharacterized protein n=1 Tax=Jatropha curcas TaxID=180498 RepID=A0A067KMN0_JATCU|nr:hypothetical protein JCGZ_06836 [Jatropha curcas]